MHEQLNGSAGNPHQNEAPDEHQFDAATVEAALRMFAPDGDLQLVSIDPFDCAEVRRPPHTFMVKGRWSAAVQWIQRENRIGRNIYWQPNRVRPDLQSKAGKADVTSARFLQVDIDPVEGREFNAAAVVERLNGVEVSPSIITFTGGGVQALWRLAEAPDA
jgi:hypothetical protein